MPPRGKQRLSRKRPNPFIIEEATESRARQEEQEQEELESDVSTPATRASAAQEEDAEEEEEGEEAELDCTPATSVTDSVAGSSQVGTPTIHRQLDAERARQENDELAAVAETVAAAAAAAVAAAVASTSASAETSTEASTDANAEAPPPTPPYFPAGLATAQDPLQFNFELFLLDSLHLPMGLFEADCAGPVHFDSVEECQDYCKRFVAERRTAAAPGGERAEENPLNLPTPLDKEEMFGRAGSSLEQFLVTGIPSCDANLTRVRKDRFGNVMILGAPSWSDLAPQFTHGYPRRLIAASHGGFLAGNMVVAARVSNEAIRSLAPGDVAAFCSEQAMANLGLTTSELLLARQMALSYSGQTRQPSRLVHAMLRYGIDFLTFSPLDADTLETLSRHASSIHRKHVTWVPPPQTSTTEDSADEAVELDSDEAEVCCSLSRRDRRLLEEDSQKFQAALLSNFVCARSNGSLPQGGEQRIGLSSALSRTGSRSRPAKRRRKSRTAPAEHPASDATDEPAEPTEVIAGPRERLSHVPGVNMARVPAPPALDLLRDFLAQHRPLSHADISAAATSSVPSAMEEAARSRLRRDRLAPATSQSLQAIWVLAKRECTCLAAPEGVTLSPTATPSEHCPYRASDVNGEQIDPSVERCTASNCLVCGFLAFHPGITNASIHMGLNKNTNLKLMVTLGTFMSELAWSEAFASVPDVQRELKAQFAALLYCKQDKLNSVLSVGFLAKHIPQLADVWLSSGWGLFWRELKKVGNALFYQGTQEARWSVLAYITETCLSADSPWHYYLARPEGQQA